MNKSRLTLKQKSNIVRIGYDKIAKEYHEQRSKYSSNSILNKFSKYLSKNAKIIDLGCGAGVPVTKFLIDNDYQVTGIDISSSMLALARKNVPHAKFMKMDITNLEFKPNSFDGAVSFYSIIHIPRETHAKIYKKLHRILKPNAIIMINPTGISNIKEWSEEYLGTPMFWSHYGPKKTLKIIKNSGFKIIWSKSLKLGGEKQFWVLARNKK